MKDIRVTTATGYIYIVREATWLGVNLIGHTDKDTTVRVFVIRETDKLEEITKD